MLTPKYRSLRGMPDILPEEAVMTRWVEDKARAVLANFGFGELRTPVMEETEVFTRSIGDDTDIVEKEMYSFSDRGGKGVSLRPEGTASVIRAYIEHGWFNQPDPVKVYYIGPMFRGERPQKGRLRQFHQIGAEIIGGNPPYTDAELIVSLDTVLKSMDLKDYTFLINSLGCSADRKLYKKELGDYLTKNISLLCEDCRRRLGTNVLRVLDCKREGCKDVTKGAPAVKRYLCEKCSGDYEGLKELLSLSGVEYREKSDLVRGLDYYTGVVFEVIHPALGAQDAMAAGGRYDSLVNQMGGPEIGAIGYAVGIERLLLTVDRNLIDKLDPGVIIIPMDRNAYREVFKTAKRLWAEGLACQMDHSGRAFKGQMRKAHKDGRKIVMIIGEDEIKQGKIAMKDMGTGEQEMLSLDEAVEKLKERQRKI